MKTCATCSKSDEACTCSTFSSVPDVQGGIAYDLGCVVDALRDLNTQLGMRAYEVRLVWTQWTGGERGAGEEFVLHECVIMPTPKVASVSALQREVTEIGALEVGALEVTEISPKYQEAYLTGKLDGRSLPEDVNFYYEIVLYPPHVQEPMRRRFLLSGVPSYEPQEFQWRVKLTRASADRTTGGDPR